MDLLEWSKFGETYKVKMRTSQKAINSWKPILSKKGATNEAADIHKYVI